MRTSIIFVCCTMLVFLSECNFNRTVSKDLISGITVSGNDLSCDDIFVTVNEEKKTGNTFVYGEKFVINFNNLTGFARTDDKVFPEMSLFVVNNSGDTVLRSVNLMSDYGEGISITPLLLTASLTVASPVKSKEDYRAIVKITDKKGTGKLTAVYPFKVVGNEKINIELNNATIGEAYVYSEEDDRVITDNIINFGKNIHIVIEGIKGFNEIDGTVFPGLSFKATDSENNIVLASEDLFAKYTESGTDAASLARRVSPWFSIPETDIKNPLHCEVIVWDKKGSARVRVTTDLVVE
ncbi:MAG: hypothetical protein WBJ37_14100 [Bacteroidales bacterium]